MTNDELDALLVIPNARERAEQALLELVRGEESDNFTLTITATGGRFTIRLDVPTACAGGPGFGEGATFAEAWHRVDPWWAGPSTEGEWEDR